MNTRQSKDKDEDVISGKQKRRFANVLTDTTLELTRRAPNEKSKIIGAFLDQQSGMEVESIARSSTKLKDQSKISPDVASDIATAGNLNQLQQRLINRGAKNQGKRLFPSEAKVTKAKKSKLKGITKDLYEVSSLKLQIRRQGQNKKVLEFCPFVYIKNYRQLLETVIENEVDEDNSTFKILPDGTKEIEVGFAGK